MVTSIMLTAVLILVIAILGILYYMMKYNSNFLKQIQSIKGIQFNNLDIGEEAPIFRIHDESGKKIVAKQLFHRKNTLLLFVNSKCPKCKSIINELDTIENHYDLKIIVINNDESFDDSLIKTKLGPSIQYVRSNHIAMSYFVHATPTAAIVERGKIKAYGKVPNFNILNNFLITEKQKEIS